MDCRRRRGSSLVPRCDVLVVPGARVLNSSFPRRSGEFKKAYPDAKLFAVKEAVDKMKKQGLEFAGGACLAVLASRPRIHPRPRLFLRLRPHFALLPLLCMRTYTRLPVWGQDAPGTAYGFEPAVQHCYFSGFANRDVAFFHPASRTLVEADLLVNLPPREQYAQAGGVRWPWTLLGGYLRPDTWMHRRFASAQGSDKEYVRRAAWRGRSAELCSGP
jgi:hypothetical protein